MKIGTEEAYALGAEDTVDAIAANGHKISYGVAGHIGSGKSTLLKMLIAMDKFKDTHYACYFDCTTKDMGDLLIPNLQSIGADGVVTFATNSELGFQYNRPIILMFDEIGKAVPPVRRAANRVALEHKIGDRTLPEGSIVFTTTNLGSEGVGDVIEWHSADRYTQIRMRKPTNIEWLENFAIPNKLNRGLMGFVKDTPQLFQSYEQVANPDDNPLIFHPADPQRNEQGFCTPRGLEKCSYIIDNKHLVSDVAFTASLIGTVGIATAKKMASHIGMLGQLPSLQSIKDDPLGAIVPERSMAAQAMIVYQALSMLERSWADAWFTYLNRLNEPMQGLFMQSVVSVNAKKQDKYPKIIRICTSNQMFRDWCFKHNYAFTADKK